MAETDIFSTEFQEKFRQNLKTSSPDAWQTLRLLESNGLMVIGYATLPGAELTLQVGLPLTQEGQTFEPAFTLRSEQRYGRLAWHFAVMAHLDKLPEDLQGLI